MRRRVDVLLDPATHPRRFTSLAAAARYLELDVRTLNKLLAAGVMPYRQIGSRRKLEVKEIAAYEARQQRRGSGT